MPKTRSGLYYGLNLNNNVKKKKFTVNIDFEEAHRMWMINKIKLQYGCYSYKK